MQQAPNDPGELIASLPALLGFGCESGLVLVGLDGAGDLGMTVATELHCPAERLAHQVVHGGASRAYAVIIGADVLAYDSDHRELATQLQIALAACDAELLDTYVVDQLCAGGRWQSVNDLGRSGTLGDPAASPLAALAVWNGRRIFTRRADLEAVVAPDARRAAVLMPLIRRQHGAPIRRGAAFKAAVRTAKLVRDGAVPADAELAMIGAALADPRVRNRLCRLSATDELAAPAQMLLEILARDLTGPWRVHALLLLAIYAYVRAEGPLAQCATNAALDAMPCHPVAQMIDAALRGGLDPSQIRRVVARRRFKAEHIAKLNRRHQSAAVLGQVRLDGRVGD